MQLLVTTGGTVTFKQLVLFVVSREFLDLVRALGVKQMWIQYGNEIKNGVHLSHQFINQCFAKRGCSLQHFQLTQLTGTVTVDELCVEFFPYSDQLWNYISRADVIISHGGTGTIIDVLKLPLSRSSPQKDLSSGVPLVVVYNDQLMDNHQQEIAHQFNLLGYCVPLASSQLTILSMEPILSQLVLGTIKLAPYNNTTSRVLQSILIDELTKGI